jgi:hypothetical protein
LEGSIDDKPFWIDPRADLETGRFVAPNPLISTLLRLKPGTTGKREINDQGGARAKENGMTHKYTIKL